MDQSGSTGGQGAPTGPASGWSAPPPPPAQPGPKGFVYADVPNRAIAYIIDAIIIGIVGLLVTIILAAIGLNATSGSAFLNTFSYNPIVSIIIAIISLAISGAYFVYTWTKRRATIGMQVLGMQIGDAGTGATLTQDQAIKRWIALGAPFTLAQAFNPFPLLGILISIAALAWFIYLVYTTYSSPTKQGWHDIFAHSMVVKATNTVA
ncbi:MAG: RDD family protein [Candidatus Limnocylindrales bacterium]